MDSDYNARTLSGELCDGTVQSMQRNNAILEIDDRTEMEQTLLRQEDRHFDALVSSFIEGC